MSVEIRTGRNVWIWARTDHDAPTVDQCIRSGASLMSRLLPDVVPGVVPPPSPKGPPDASRYFMGAARPMDVRASQKRPPVPPGQTWRASEQQELFRVASQNTWFVSVDFDWRSPTYVIEEWPRRKVNILGFAVDDPLNLDWLLMTATHTGPATRPDGDFTGDVASTAADTTKAVTGASAAIGLMLAALAVVVYVGGHKRR